MEKQIQRLIITKQIIEKKYANKSMPEPIQERLETISESITETRKGLNELLAEYRELIEINKEYQGIKKTKEGIKNGLRQPNQNNETKH